MPPELFRPVYSLLAEKWWLWAFSIPVTIHPLFDATGELCDVGQSGPVWYLGGSFVGGAIERTCTVPRGKFICLPILHTECSSLEPEPFICTNKSECLACNDAKALTARAAITGLNRLEIYLGGAIYWITANSLIEEYVWRWFVFRKPVRSRTSSWT